MYTAYLSQPFTIIAKAFDPDAYPGTALTYNWTQISGPAIAVFDNPNILTPTVTAPSPGLYVFAITVSDSLNPSTLQVSVNVLPLFTGTQAYTAYCNTGSTGAPVVFNGIASSNLSSADANSKALLAATTAANAALVCAVFPALPNIQINIFGITQVRSGRHPDCN